MKINYLNYLKTEHIIDVTSMNEREVIIIIWQKNLVKMKNIQKKLHKLQVLYELNEHKNNELMLWEEMRSLTKIIKKLTCQHVTASTVN